MNNLEIRLKEKGAMLIQPQAVNDGSTIIFIGNRAIIMRVIQCTDH